MTNDLQEYRDLLEWQETNSPSRDIALDKLHTRIDVLKGALSDLIDKFDKETKNGK